MTLSILVHLHLLSSFVSFSQGEYIAPEKVENIYARSTLVAQVYHYGDSLKSACVAIIVPDEEVLTKWASDNGVSGSFEDLCKNEVSLKRLVQYKRIAQPWGRAKRVQSAVM